MATLAEQIQHAIDQGIPLDVIRRRFHLSESDLQDYCADIMDDDSDENQPGSVSGY